MENIQIKSKKRNVFLFRFILVAVFVVFFAYYVSKVLFLDDKSYEIYKDLRKNRIQLKQKVNEVLQENVKIQKDYLNLKNLEQ